LEAGLWDVMERHESLRTIFPEREGVAHQEILAASAVRARLVVSAVSEAALAGALGGAAGEGFDLSAEPPLRAHLFELSEGAHVLLLLLHHIAGDGWSLAPLLGDLAHCYAARRSGQAPGLAPLPVQYADYTLWQHEVLGQESDGESAIARQLGFWRGQLAGLPDAIDLPSDRARPAVASPRGGGGGFGLVGELAVGVGGLSAGGGSEPVHGAASWLGGLAHAAWGRQRHCDRQPDCGAQRQRARRSRGFLCEHAGAAHGHLWGSEPARADWAGSRRQSFGLR